MSGAPGSKFETYGIELDDALDRIDAGILVPRFMVHKFGKDETTASGAFLEPTNQAFPYSYTYEASTVRVKAGGHADDTSAGDGARTVQIQGLDANYAPLRETVTLAGASASSSTTAEFLRVLRVRVQTAGVNEVNTGAIVIERTDATADLATIIAGECSSQIGAICVPAGYECELLDIRLDTSAVAGSATVKVRGWSRKYDPSLPAGTTAPRQIFFEKVGLARDNAGLGREFPDPYTFTEKTDVWFDAVPSSGTPVVAVSFTAGFNLG